jgi:hypothetical protein
MPEQHEQDVVLVLAGIHAASQRVARGPKGRIQVGFFDSHSYRLLVILKMINSSSSLGKWQASTFYYSNENEANCS